MKAYACDQFPIPLPEWHRFPMTKYARLRERIEQTSLIEPGDLLTPRAATFDEILRVHDADYLRKVSRGTLTPDEVRMIGFPWTALLVERSRRSVGATIEASLASLVDGVAVNLAGGTHHAFRDRGAGYCVFNDAAIASRYLQDHGHVLRVLIVDCDVHQGDGTASIFADDPTVFTFSIHGANNFPPVKQTSDLDIELEDGTGDATYLEHLERGLKLALDRAGAEQVIYLAGADPFLNDQLGRLKLTKAGLSDRDKLVLGSCRQAGLPVVVTMAGGYAENVEDTVDIHFETVRQAVAFATTGRPALD